MSGYVYVCIIFLTMFFFSLSLSLSLDKASFPGVSLVSIFILTLIKRSMGSSYDLLFVFSHIETVGGLFSLSFPFELSVKKNSYNMV